MLYKGTAGGGVKQKLRNKQMTSYSTLVNRHSPAVTSLADNKKPQ